MVGAYAAVAAGRLVADHALLDHDHVYTRLGQEPCRGQSRNARSDDYYFCAINLCHVCLRPVGYCLSRKAKKPSHACGRA